MFTQLVRHRRLRSQYRATAASLAVIFLSVLVAPVFAATVTVPAGTKVPLEFAQSVDSGTAHKGDLVKLRVHEDVMVNGEKVIAAGAPATARVAEVKKPKPFGGKAEIKINQLRVRAANGREMQLDQYNSGKRFMDPKAGGAATGGLILLGPIGLAAGAFFKGGHMLIKSGTHIDAAVNDTPVTVAAR